MTNELTNPGFEGGRTNGPVIWWTPEGKSNQEFDNIFVSDGWVVWWLDRFPSEGDPDRLLGRPEFTVINWDSFSDKTRIRSGKQAIKAHIQWRPRDCGLMQFVDVPGPGTYRFSIYAHSLYTECGGHWHENAIYDKDCRTKITWAEDRLTVGIDPLGGGDPFAASVVWSEPVSIYGKYIAEPLSIEVEVSSREVTVFFRSTTTHALMHGDVYIDDASLVLVDEPQPGVCRGHPRIQYARTYNAYGNITDEQYQVIADYARKNNETVGGSFDDGGVGDLDYRRVRIWYLPEDKHQEYLDWYALWYPGVIVEFKNSVPSDPFARWRPYAQSQNSLLWADVKRAGTNCVLPWNSIGNDGCWDTDTSMAQNVLGLRVGATPVTVNEELGPGSFTSDCQVTWAGMKRCNLEVVALVENYQQIIDWLADGNLAFADTLAGGGKHFWLLVEWDADEDKFIGIDPWDGEVKWLSPRNVDDYRLIRAYEEEPPNPPLGEVISIHIQGGGQGDAEFIRDVQPSVVKFITGMERCAWAKGLSPRTLTVYRHFPNHSNHLDPYLKNPNGPYAGAKLFYSEFADALARNHESVDFIESLNEIYATGDTEGIKRSVEFDCNFCRVVEEEGLLAHPVALISGVGNPQHGAETRLLIPAARELERLGGAASHHGYDGCRIEGDSYFSTLQTPGESYHYSMRGLLSWDREFTAAGVYVKHISTECGAIYVAPWGGMPSATAGWKYKETLKANWDWYVAEILELRRQIAEWNKTHNNRCLGFTLFNVGGGGDPDHWSLFELAGRLEALAVVLTA